MAKDIKDYLHLYLGCEAGFPTGKGVLKGVTEWAAYVEDSSKTLYSISINNVVPHLRKLSDITEGERAELTLIVPTSENLFWVKNIATITKWYLERHFDLFGLIEEKLAIDKATLTQLSTTNGKQG